MRVSQSASILGKVRKEVKLGGDTRDRDLVVSGFGLINKWATNKYFRSAQWALCPKITFCVLVDKPTSNEIYQFFLNAVQLEPKFPKIGAKCNYFFTFL